MAKAAETATGKGKAAIPYALNLADGTVIRIKGSGDSPWGVSGDLETGYTLARDGEPGMPVSFVPLPRWMAAQTSDGFSMARSFQRAAMSWAAPGAICSHSVMPAMPISIATMVPHRSAMRPNITLPTPKPIIIAV